MKAPGITVIILTFNEELHISRCIENIKPIAQDIIVVDSFSTDKTIEIANKLGAKVFQNTFINHSIQFQWALDNCPINTEWLMRLDADEYLELPLINEILEKLPNFDHTVGGVFLKRKHYFLGRWIKHGDRYPITLLRIWRPGKAHIEQRWMDEHIILDEGYGITLNENFVDDNLNPVSWFIDKHNKYATREMIEIIGHKTNIFSLHKHEYLGDLKFSIKRMIKINIYNKLPIFFRPILYFFYRYILRLGFLDGIEGFAYHFMQGFWYRCLVDLKCFEAENIIKGAQSKDEIILRLEKLTGINVKGNRSL